MMNGTSNPKLGLIKGDTVSDSGNLWAGANNEQYYGDDILNQQNGKPLVFPLNVKNWIKKINTVQPTTQTPTTQTPVGFDIATFVSENKWFLLGGVALLGYMVFSGGLGATDRTVTSVTRFAPKK